MNENGFTFKKKGQEADDIRTKYLFLRGSVDLVGKMNDEKMIS